MNRFSRVLISGALAIPTLAFSQEVVVGAIEKPRDLYYRGVKSQQDVSIVGDLRVVQMRYGATWVLISQKLGQVKLFTREEISPMANEKLDSIQNRKALVSVSGSLLMRCTDKQLQKGDGRGCRDFDITKKIKVAVR